MVKMDDKSIVYQAVSMMDRFFAKNYGSIAQFDTESKLTSFVSLFMASKNSEVEPLNMKDIKNHFLNRRFCQD